MLKPFPYLPQLVVELNPIVQNPKLSDCSCLKKRSFHPSCSHIPKISSGRGNITNQKKEKIGENSLQLILNISLGGRSVSLNFNVKKRKTKFGLG